MPREGHSDGTPGLPPVSRRGFLKTAGATIAITSLDAAASAARAARRDDPKVLKGEVPVAFTLNGKAQSAVVGTGVTLLDLLRDQLDLTGTKMVCDRGACGACTVHVDGRTVNSCLMLAVDAEGRSITTVEGLANGDVLSPVQAAFCAEDGLQCGFCTPGMIMSCTALLAKNPTPSRAEAAAGIAGNICRCGTYFNIFRAVDRAAATMKSGVKKEGR